MPNSPAFVTPPVSAPQPQPGPGLESGASTSSGVEVPSAPVPRSREELLDLLTALKGQDALLLLHRMKRWHAPLLKETITVFGSWMTALRARLDAGLPIDLASLSRPTTAGGDTTLVHYARRYFRS